MAGIDETSKSNFRQLGKGAVEYIVVAALIAVAGVAVYSLFGDVVG